MTSTEIAKSGGALAIRADQTEWTPAQAAVLQQAGVSDDVTPAELSGFLHLCQRTELDPFSRQIYLIGRNDKRKGRVVFTPQTGIDGYRVIAHRAARAAAETLGYEDTLWCGRDGVWHDVWPLADAPVAAKVTVLRNGGRFSAVAQSREYMQGFDGKPSGLWAKMPAQMVAKCAEALALRKAFPYDLAGVYTAEEMAQAENTAPAVEQQNASVRQLRPPQQDEPDPWQTPEPTAQANPAAQDLADRGAKCQHRGEARPLWPLGKVGHLMEAPVLAPDTGELDQLGFYLTRLLKALPEAPAEMAEGSESNDDDVVDAEVLPADPVTEQADMVKALRRAASAAGVADAELEEAFELAYGTPVAEGAIANLQDMTTKLRRAA